MFWLTIYAVVLLLSFHLNTVSSQGLSCYTCMTTNPKADHCADPFSSILNPIQVNCQATSKDRNGSFPARYCMKISGRILSVDGTRNRTFINSYIYYRSCLVDNIMDSSKSLEISGNFRLKGILDRQASFRVHGSLSLCTFDGCNSAEYSNRTNLIVVLLWAIVLYCQSSSR